LPAELELIEVDAAIIVRKEILSTSDAAFVINDKILKERITKIFKSVDANCVLERTVIDAPDFPDSNYKRAKKNPMIIL